MMAMALVIINRDTERWRGVTKSDQLTAWAREHIGCPYIFGAAGQTCTPSYRRSVMTNKPEYAAAIRDNCPVLSGKQAACGGCRYNGKPAYDCRGLTREGMRAVTGRPVMGAGATSQWNDGSNWAEKGEISALPRGKVFMVFVRKGSTMSHTGIYFDGQAVHASGHKAGVISSPMPRSWTHYAIPIGLYDGEEDGGTVARELVYTKGQPYMRGDDVRHVQNRLIALGYGVGPKGVDGVYGNDTFTAVKIFQHQRGLIPDGKVDASTLAALNATTAPTTPPESVWTAEQVDLLTAELDALKIAINALYAHVDKITLMLKG